MNLAVPILSRHGRHWVVRDDLLPGGTKMRALLPLILASSAAEFVYAAPAQGYAQLALAHCTRMAGRRGTVFVAARRELHPLTQAAADAGAQIVQVSHGRLAVVRARARAYAAEAGAELLPFGLDADACIEAIAAEARLLPVRPAQVWSVAGSGVLTRALQRAWPGAEVHAVLVGRQGCDTGRAVRWTHPAAFDAPAGIEAPFPSARCYDAKGWELMQQQRAPEGALFWNVAG